MELGPVCRSLAAGNPRMAARSLKERHTHE